MLRTLVAIALVAGSAAPLLAAVPHPVPKDRSSLTVGDWFPYVFSKVAPLEEWNVILSPTDIVRDRFSSDSAFQRAKADTFVIPRFCFTFFRADPVAYGHLASAIENYRGAVVWMRYNNCVGAFAQQFTFYQPMLGGTVEETMKRLQEAVRNPPKPDPDVVKKAIDDIPHFCQYLESQLGLENALPPDFDTNSLTKEGLLTSRGLFQDFVEPGDHMPWLTRTPEHPDFTSSEHNSPSFGVGASEMGKLLGELGARYDRPANESVAPNYPLLSRLSDVASEARYQPQEVHPLLAEITRAQQAAKRPPSLRALDKLYRIATWAGRYDTGIFFDCQ